MRVEKREFAWESSQFACPDHTRWVAWEFMRVDRIWPRVAKTLINDSHQNLSYTRKNAQVVTNLQQTCSQLVLCCSQLVLCCSQLVLCCSQLVLCCSQLVLCCSQLVDKLSQGCWTRQTCYKLFQQVLYSHDIAILLQPCVVNLVTFLLYHDCIRLVRTTL
jgi:hypothetical protein